MNNSPLILLLSVSIAAGMALAQPRLTVVEGLKIDLGRVDRGKIAAGRLTLKNTGDQILTLGKIESSCGCTGTVLSKNELKPGDTTSLLITFNSRAYSGPIQESLSIPSNSASTPRTAISVLATVVEDLTFSPAWFHFKDAPTGQQSTAVVKVKNQSRKNLSITGFRTQLSHFTIRYPRKSFAPGRTVDLTAEFTPENDTPVLGDAVYVTTSSQIQPELYIRVFRTVKKAR